MFTNVVEIKGPLRIVGPLLLFHDKILLSIKFCDDSISALLCTAVILYFAVFCEPQYWAFLLKAILKTNWPIIIKSSKFFANTFQ